MSGILVYPGCKFLLNEGMNTLIEQSDLQVIKFTIFIHFLNTTSDTDDKISNNVYAIMNASI